MDNLIDRLRGFYKVGSNNEFGTIDFSQTINIPSISLEAANRIEVLEKELQKYGWHTSNCYYLLGSSCNCGYLKALKTTQ